MIDDIPDQREVVISAKTGRARQAGADGDEGSQILRWRALAERDLYFFAKFIGGSHFLTPRCHGWMCRKIQHRGDPALPETRKLILMPREHAKSRIASQCLPPHVLIQPAESNCYFPGKVGADTRILLCGENGTKIEAQMRVVMGFFETNSLFRALWPHLIWPNPNRDAKVWNAKQFIVPRPTPFADPSVIALGAESAVTGSRTDFQIKDDLISLAASRSPALMQQAIEFHISTKPLQESILHSWEVILGTLWAPADLYEYIRTNEPWIKVYLRKILEDGVPLWPEHFPPEAIELLRKETKELFHLNYMNEATHGSLVDFDPHQLRYWELTDGRFTFDEDPRDTALAQLAGKPLTVERAPDRYTKLTTAKLTEALGRDEFLRLKHG